MVGTKTFLALAVLALAAASAQAGCKRRRNPLLTEADFSFNHEHADVYKTIEDAPSSLNWNDIDGKSLLAPSWNQHIPHYCGSCWLHGTTSMLQDRLKIAKEGAGPDVMLARQVVLNCGAFHGYGAGCDGGDVIDVLHYASRFGLPDESCQVYEAADHTRYGPNVTECPASGYCRNCMPIKDKDACWAVKTPIRYFVESFGRVSGPGELPMLNELSRGPVTCSIATPDEFSYGYHSGVYVDADNSTDVDHDIEVVGWGEEEDVQALETNPDAPPLKYWIVRNSWGTYFGRLGFFKVQRGVNALQIEAGDCWGATLSFKDEQAIRDGDKVGTMWGIFTKEEAAKILPEPHRKPHHGDGLPAAAMTRPVLSLARPVASAAVAGEDEGPARLAIGRKGALTADQ